MFNTILDIPSNNLYCDFYNSIVYLLHIIFQVFYDYQRAQNIMSYLWHAAFMPMVRQPCYRVYIFMLLKLRVSKMKKNCDKGTKQILCKYHGYLKFWPAKAFIGFCTFVIETFTECIE